MANLQKFKKITKSKGLDGFIVTSPINIFYLTGFRGITNSERESILVLAKRATLIAPRLYQNEAKKLTTRTLAVAIVTERHLMLETTMELLKKCQRIGFEQEDLKYGEYRDLDSRFRQVILGLSSLTRRGNDKRGRNGLAPTKNLVEQMRVIKTIQEIAKIEKAQIISQLAFDQVVKTIRVGQTEEEIAEKITRIIKSLGAQGLAFESIIASGPNSGMPHHATGARRLVAGDTLLLDFGAKYQNYLGDLSRTVFIGRANDRQKNIYHHVKAAQSRAIGKIKSGIKSSDVYHEANNHFKKHKLEAYFLHGLGHGVGLEIHENPYLRPTINDPLLENMVFSVEPGLYFPWGGIRIEDLAVVNDSRAKVLGRQSPDFLIEIV